nr:MAG TPA: hypothetical protein [Bacteriophage sp.]
MCSLMLLLKVLRTEIAQSQPLEKHIKKQHPRILTPTACFEQPFDGVQHRQLQRHRYRSQWTLRAPG